MQVLCFTCGHEFVIPVERGVVTAPFRVVGGPKGNVSGCTGRPQSCGPYTKSSLHMADSFAQTVKQQTDIVRIVGDYVKLRKSGANWSALCPFHKEKSGSFYLYPATSSYYCFGCHEHGDVFTFVMKMENVSFPEAVRSVASKMGIP